MKKNIILISGPSGSGKTSLAKMINEKCNFVIVSEDKFWGKLKASQPINTERTPQEEIIIQNQVITEICEIIHSGENVVFEFILYSDPPSPLLTYIEAFKDIANILVVLLKPNVETILLIKKVRARENEQDIIIETNNAINQLNCLNSTHIKKEWIVENQNLTIEETYDRFILPKLKL